MFENKIDLDKFLFNDTVHVYLTGRYNNLHIFRNRLYKITNCFPVSGIQLYNVLPNTARNLNLVKLSILVKDL